MADDDKFREKVTKCMELLVKSKKYREYLKQEISDVEGYIATLAADGVNVSEASGILNEAKIKFPRAGGLTDYAAVGNQLNTAKAKAYNADLKVQEIIAIVDQTLGNIEKYSKMGLDMSDPLRVLVALRNKIRLHELDTAMLFASEAWTQTEDIRQRFEQINTYLEELVRRYEQCESVKIATEGMPVLLGTVRKHIASSDMNGAYKEMEELTKLLDTAQTDHINKLLEDAYYEIELQPDIDFTQVQETLSQAEYALYNADFFTAIDLAKKAGPLVEANIKEYQSTLDKVETVSQQIFHAKNLGVNVYQAESILSEANRMLVASDFRMAEEYARQAETELDIMRDEIQWRERASMENMYKNVRDSLMTLNRELQENKKKGVDMEDAETLVEKIIENMEDASTMEDYKKMQEYISATYSAMSRSQARHSRNIMEKQEGRRELDGIRGRLAAFEGVCVVPGEIKDFMEKAFEAYDKDDTVDMKRDVGQIEQFMKEMEQKKLDVDVGIKILKERVSVEDWVLVDITLTNNSNPHIRSVRMKMDGVVDQKGFHRIDEIPGHGKATVRMKIRFQSLGQNQLTFNTMGMRALDGRKFKLKEKANVFVGPREELEGYIDEVAVDWG